MTPRITVVVPAFKGRYLGQMLLSLQRQSDPDFEVFVGDDASPDDIKGICDAHSAGLRIRYLRYERNLGGRDLAGQWNRCLDEVQTEWVLMPGDDDFLDTDCIKSFKRAIVETGGVYPAYRGTLMQVDQAGRELRRQLPAQRSTARDQAESIGSGLEMVIEYMFSLRKLRELGGFVSFPLGWFSDNATWILLASAGGIAGVPGAIICGRASMHNISAYSSGTQLQKLESAVQFLEWLFEKRVELGFDTAVWQELLERFSWLWAVNCSQFAFKPSFAKSAEWSFRLGRLGGRSPFRYLVRQQGMIWKARSLRKGGELPCPRA